MRGILMSFFDDRVADVRTTWIVFRVLVSINFGAMCILFYRRRHLQPISARRFPWAFGKLVLWWLYMYHPTIRYLWFDQPCVMVMVTSIIFQATLWCYFMR